MQQSRSDRLARGKRKRARHIQRYAAFYAILLVLAAGIYYIWNHDSNSDLSGRGSTPGINEQDSIDEAEEMNEPDNRGVKETDSASDSASDSSEVQPAEGAKSEDKEKAEPRKVSLALVGDIMMGGRIDDLLRKNGFDYPYLHVAQTLQEADIAAGNLENPITDRGEPSNKTYTFRTSPEAVPAMKESGFDVFNLANNHTLDYGLVGMRDTIQHLKDAELGHMGAGENDEEAFRPYTVEKNGLRIDFLGFTNVVPNTTWKAEKNAPGLAETYSYTRAVAAIERSEAEADIVVVFVHWGLERKETPEPYMIDNAHRYIDAGADLVVGSHPHVLNGLEVYKDRWIAYSLGNFIFTVNPTSPNKNTAIMQAVCDQEGKCEIKMIPMVTGIGQPVPASEAEAAEIFAKLNALSIGAEIHANGEVTARTDARTDDETGTQ